MLLSRKPHCNWCERRGSADGRTDYELYPCSCPELAARFPDKCLDGCFMVKEKMRCPDKRYFKPLYTMEQVKVHNHHK